MTAGQSALRRAITVKTKEKTFTVTSKHASIEFQITPPLKYSKQGKQSKQSKQGKQGKQDKQGKQGKQNNQSGNSSREKDPGRAATELEGRAGSA
jgi:hypothetical protein